MNKKFIVQEVMLEKRYFPIIEDNEILKTALDKMNSFGHGIVCLINFKSELIGIITDGDIRRRLLSSQKPLSAMFVDDAIKHSIKSPITVLNSTKGTKIARPPCASASAARPDRMCRDTLGPRTETATGSWPQSPSDEGDREIRSLCLRAYPQA